MSDSLRASASPIADGGHTPGPWEVVYSPQRRPYGIDSALAQDAPGNIKHVVRWAGIGFPSSPEATANARLIAAAPELWEALRDSLFWLEGALQCDKFEWSADQAALATYALERGLHIAAKAEGQPTPHEPMRGLASKEADACLIAAAPDLLDALKRLYETSGRSRNLSKAREHAEAAIAKAEGRS